MEHGFGQTSSQVHFWYQISRFRWPCHLHTPVCSSSSSSLLFVGAATIRSTKAGWYDYLNIPYTVNVIYKLYLSKKTLKTFLLFKIFRNKACQKNVRKHISISSIIGICVWRWGFHAPGKHPSMSPRGPRLRWVPKYRVRVRKIHDLF